MDSQTVLRVNMFGEFSMTYGDTTIMDQNSRSHKVWTLLEYVVTFRDKEISQNELIELLWPEEDDIGDPSNTLKTLLHRVRSQLGQLGEEDLRKAVTYRRGSYRWAPEIPCHIDVSEFDALCKRASKEDDPNKRLSALQQAIRLYKGDFLPRSALDSWVMPINTYYRTQYIKIVYEAIELLTQTGRFSEALAICQKAVTIDIYDEGLHLAMIKCLLATGAQRAALQHYKYVTDLFFTQFGVSPSDEMTALYKDVVKTDKNMELDFGVIKEGLQELDPKSRAFCCEYEFFKDIYQLEARGAMRTGEVIHIALITITSDSRKPLTQKQTNLTMDRLGEVIGTSLRRNDVYTRYSVTQYLMMLPSANFENAQMVVNRIVAAFRSQYPKMPVTLQNKVLPLDPLET
ncbi:BTAD domain-containing putative transcriptional regulator [Bengtsoniella intestinalis]|uniref:AfsR/SARP family transcriptional regulator n=1 Tax=Bengtsoniella intestinalis TaxID=3073143 RepID=UPI00391EE4E5